MGWGLMCRASFENRFGLKDPILIEVSSNKLWKGINNSLSKAHCN